MSIQKIYPFDEQPVYEMSYNDSQLLNINPVDTEDGNSALYVPFRTQDFVVKRFFYDGITTIDLNSNGINGVLDGFGLQASTKYNLWAFGNKNDSTAGFGLMAIPVSSFRCSALSKGDQGSFTYITKAYQYTVGARVRIEPTASGEWNLGTILSIDSATSMTIQLDNNNVWGATYGTAFTAQGSTAGSITQLDKFRAYTPDDSSQSYLYDYNRVIGELHTDGSSNIKCFNKLVTEYDLLPPGSVIPWDGSATNSPELPNGWVLMDGSTCMIDKSPYIGQTMKDVNGENRFPRFSDTSGTDQAATEINTATRYASSDILVNPTNSDGSGSSSITARATGASSGSASSLTFKVRPINTSFIGIKKVI